MDNAGCHPPEIKDGYSNIKVVFLPANTTSRHQPLDLGIIKNFKVHYRKLFFGMYVVAKIDECHYDIRGNKENTYSPGNKMDSRSLGISYC